MSEGSGDAAKAGESENPLAFWVGLAAVIAFFAGAGIVSYVNTQILLRNARLVTQTHDTILALEDVFSIIKDAETGQRGYLITGDDAYLDPYNRAIERVDQRLAQIAELLRNDPASQRQLTEVGDQVKRKLKELAETIALRRDSGFEAAREVVVTDRGKAAMDAIRDEIGGIQAAVRALREKRFLEMENAYQIAIGSGLVTGLLGIALCSVVGLLVQRSMLARRRQAWLLTGQTALSQTLMGDPPVDQVSERALQFLTRYLSAQAGAFFIREHGRFVRKATYGVPETSDLVATFQVGDGLLGQAVKESRQLSVNDVPENYLIVGSALGKSKPRYLFIAPLSFDKETFAVLELGFFQPMKQGTIELLSKVSESIAIAVQSAQYRAHLQELLEETQRQSEELQTQSEELRVSNEELEEQGRALRESQMRMEQQQLELEQINSQLEEQAQQLEHQRDEISRSNANLEAQTQQLEQASTYKSHFLANMSHELRTPLNSSLILAKLLADNPQGNLTEEQVRFAETIGLAGNDLLNLINDILDLSKIEAGKMELHAERVQLKEISEELRQVFEPLAIAKNISLQVGLAADCPASIYTDRQRLQQILKNLLANAIKFTERGEATLTIEPAVNACVRFVVRDTGIGIPRENLQAIFEAFRQADGASHRKFGGTGLGLSIAKELARLLGGSIEVESNVGKGSTFSLTIPLVVPKADVPRPESPGRQTVERPRFAAIKDSALRSDVTLPASTTPQLGDDRDGLKPERRVLLVIEDDHAFASILGDIAHELNFQCLIATSAATGLADAEKFRPDAIVLDVGLPDQSGLSVLDRLKQHPTTRHIPVHIISAHDYVERALTLGAVGYVIKPAKREQLVAAVQGLEERFAQPMRRVLVVEDDPIQLDSLKHLLRSHRVEVTGADSAAACLEQLRSQHYDCMVLDLSLPDATGYSLLETLANEDQYSFPPVIVYTGRDLSIEEEQRLRRYSKSIILKGAKSPERLLDEVTLFLHQIVSELPSEQQKLLEKARQRDAALEGRRILIVEDDVRNIFALTSLLEPRGAKIEIARNGRDAIALLEQDAKSQGKHIDLVLMDVMMPEMDGLTATREIRKLPGFKKLPIIVLTAKAMKDDQETCLAAGASDYMAKPLDIDKLLSLIRVWMPR